MFSLTSGIPQHYNQLFAKTDKMLGRHKKFLSKISTEENNSKTNCKAVPLNATIREEHIKCGKPYCLYCPHGPYYYAYWREKGKLKKKYIGTKYEPEWRKYGRKHVNPSMKAKYH